MKYTSFNTLFVLISLFSITTIALKFVACSRPHVCYRAIEVERNSDRQLLIVYATAKGVEQLHQLSVPLENAPKGLKIGDLFSPVGEIATFTPVKNKERAIPIVADGIVRCKHSQ